ncbi:MAG: xanthine dehydrogenase family protein molybdopterin-binding subunit, partial [Sulfolobaceae archaeon]|nr:xanthine dehydrogenase family protein molybdopterin-binding subunit [Sulfolobaceae archaeon]
MQQFVGKPIRRIEDPKLITGSGRYVNDYEFPGTLYLAIYRSPVAHARLKKVDVTDALKQSNVIDVITGLTYKVPNRPRNFPMAVDELLYVGQPIAAVLATDPYSAFDALDYIQIDYDPLEPVVDPEKALEDKIKAVEGKSNIAYRRTYLAGNPDEALRNSQVVIED